MPEQTNILNAIKTVVREEIRPMEERLEGKITYFRNEILTSNDKVIKKLDKILTELPATTHSLDEHHKEIVNLKTRTTKLEVHTGFVSSPAQI